MHISGFSNKFFSEIVIRRQAPGPLLSYCTLTYLTLTQNQRFDIKISQKLNSFKPIKNGFKFYGLKLGAIGRPKMPYETPQLKPIGLNAQFSEIMGLKYGLNSILLSIIYIFYQLNAEYRKYQIVTCLANWAISSLKDSAEVMSPDVRSRGEFEASSHL